MAGRLYPAPPDHYLLIQTPTDVLGRGPREDGSRPAIDPLVRTASAHEFGPRAIGVVLSGSLSDGTDGLSAIKEGGRRRGGAGSSGRDRGRQAARAP